jgi:hypothetical protein
MACVTDMDCSNNTLPRRARKKLQKIGLMYEPQMLKCTYYSVDIFFLTSITNTPFFLQKFSPWEIPRHDVVFPVRFFGHVEILPDGS